MSTPRRCESFESFGAGNLGEAAPSMRNQPLEFFGKRKKDMTKARTKAENETTTVVVAEIPEPGGRTNSEAK